MDFAWAMKALGEGKKVTRRSLAGDPPIYLYWNKANDTIMRDYGARTDAAWKPSLDSVLAEDWEEYVEPKKDPVKDTKDWTDYAGGIVCTGEDTGYMAEQLEMLADIYAEKISQRVAQLLQKS